MKKDIRLPAIALAAVSLWAAPAAALAQQPAPVPPAAMPQAATSIPVPSPLELNKMIWSTMVSLDQANLAGNYSVLRDLAAPSFQIENDSAKLANIFTSLRQSKLDLSAALLVAPTLTAPPAISGQNVLRVQGRFGLRPTAIAFDISYQWIMTRWQLVGVSIAPATIASEMPGPPPPDPRARPTPAPGRR